MTSRTIVRWTDTAKTQLAELPKKVRQGILAKARRLGECAKPEGVHKPLHGPLEGYFRFTYARYRAVYKVEREELASGDILELVTITFIAVGKRAERNRDDIYRIAETMVNHGLIEINLPNEEEDTIEE